MILDDTDRESLPETSQQQPSLALEQTVIEQHSTIHLDTSRFAEGHLKDLTTNRSNISTLSLLIDPREHVRTLKSPLRDRLVNYFVKNSSNSRSRSPQNSQNNSQVMTTVVISAEATRKSKIGIPILGQSMKPKRAYMMS